MGMKEIREMAPEERMVASYWEAVRSIYHASGGIVSSDTVQTVATIYGRDPLVVAVDIERGTP